jgi:hypothetical protein
LNIKKIIAFLLCIVVFISMLITFAAFVKPVKAEEVSIVNHQGYLDASGYFYVCGEVQNIGGTAAKNVYVKIAFTSDSGVVEDPVATVLNVLLAGRKAPFYERASEQGSLVKSYSVELMDLTMPSEDLPEVLTIVSSKSEIDFNDYMTVTGTVENDGAETAIYTRVYATFYDGPSGTGNVVAVASGVAEPYNLDPGQTGNFQMGFSVTPGKSYVSYVLTAESAQYAATAEYMAATDQPSATPTSTASPTLSPIDSTPTVPELPYTPILMVLAGLITLSIVIIMRKNSEPAESNLKSQL